MLTEVTENRPMLPMLAISYSYGRVGRVGLQQLTSDGEGDAFVRALLNHENSIELENHKCLGFVN